MSAFDHRLPEGVRSPADEGVGTTGTGDARELARFARLAEAAWDPSGPMAGLHKLNPPRIDFIRRQVTRHLGEAMPNRTPLRPFTGLRFLDIGCGAGLLSEPLARLGARVTAVDAAAANIEVARRHASEGGLDIDYRVATPEELLSGAEPYDLVVASEVVEHVADLPVFLQATAALTRRRGLALFSTLSRSVTSLLGAIVAAEYILGWVPRGTHDWRRFLTPAELARHLRHADLRPCAVEGLALDAATGRFARARRPRINYLMAALRD